MSAGPASFFGPGGRLAAAHPGYERREGQERMAEEVARVLGTGGTLMAEAGTGTGKTLAYLVPAIESRRRVIVSTGTKNLQDQIFERDLPFLRDAAGYRFSACRMKGRDNYLCRMRFAEFARSPTFEVLSERRFLDDVAAWAAETGSGDRAELARLPDRARFWRDINARADTCVGSRCVEFDTCWLTKMKREAADADIVVVNHHLFFADLAIRGPYGAILPEYDTVVFDEAHLLEEVATLYFGLRVSSAAIEELARDAERLDARAGGVAVGGGGAGPLRAAAGDFFAPIRQTVARGGRVAFPAVERGGPDLEGEWAALSHALEEVGALAERHVDASGSPSAGFDVEDPFESAATRRRPSRDLSDAADSVRRRCRETILGLARVLERDDPGFVYGAESRGRGTIVLSAVPIDVSEILRERLFGSLHACVLTSATLAVEREFEFFRGRLGVEDPVERIVGSPFDPETQARLYLPDGIPEPRDPGFVPAACGEIRRLLEITDGRAFLLFTSYAMLDRVREDLERDARWPLFAQGDGAKAALVDAFRETPRAVLLGTTSFWHGVDVPGDALSMVVIDKLPFDVPSDPLVAARIARIREAGGNPFREYQTPMAVLDLKQGLGRLLRRSDDRGLLAVLDPRLRTKPYGKTFLRSLPQWPIVRDLDACRAFFHGAS